LLRKFAVLAALGAIVVGVVAVAAEAAVTYLFRPAVGAPPVRDGKFGENFQLHGSVTLTAAGAPANACTADIGGQVTKNQPTGGLAASAPSHVFSGCSTFPSWAAGNWTLSVPQGKSGAVKNGKVSGVDVILQVAASPDAFCEYKGTMAIQFTNGSPSSTVSLPGTSGDTLKLNPSTNTGSFTTPGAPCPLTGVVSGSLDVTAASNPLNNIVIS